MKRKIKTTKTRIDSIFDYAIITLLYLANSISWIVLIIKMQDIKEHMIPTIETPGFLKTFSDAALITTAVYLLIKLIIKKEIMIAEAILFAYSYWMLIFIFVWRVFFSTN